MPLNTVDIVYRGILFDTVPYWKISYRDIPTGTTVADRVLEAPA